MNKAEQFFYEHAGYFYGPDETPEQGRARCSRELAAAETAARDAGISFQWDVDPYATSADFCDDKPTWSLWRCLARNAQGKPVTSLCAIDFGPDSEPWGDPYRRVVEAELALEALAQ